MIAKKKNINGTGFHVNRLPSKEYLLNVLWVVDKNNKWFEEDDELDGES